VRTGKDAAGRHVTITVGRTLVYTVYTFDTDTIAAHVAAWRQGATRASRVFPDRYRAPLPRLGAGGVRSVGVAVHPLPRRAPRLQLAAPGSRRQVGGGGGTGKGHIPESPLPVPVSGRGYGEASGTNAALRPWRPLGANHRRPPAARSTPSGPGGHGYRELSRPAGRHCSSQRPLEREPLPHQQCHASSRDSSSQTGYRGWPTISRPFPCRRIASEPSGQQTHWRQAGRILQAEQQAQWVSTPPVSLAVRCETFH